MERNSQLQALVLHIKQLGENNRLVTFLSSKQGIFTAVLYGGAKSKLRSLVSPGHFGNLWIYNDTSKNSIKITDFEVLKYHPELRENLYKNWCFSFASELAIKSECGGEYEKASFLINAFIDGISISTENECRIALLRFIWRYLDIIGLQPNCQNCLNCENTFENGAIFSFSESGFLCNECAPLNLQNRQDLGYFPLSKEGITFLQAITYLSPKEARNIPLHFSTTQQLHDLLIFLISNAVEGKLKTIELEKAI